jgi:hypothetical protein
LSIATLITATLLVACGQDQAGSTPAPAADKPAATPVAEEAAIPTADTPARNLYWGDTHLHTSYSPDAFLMQNRSATPDTAYQYARGLPVIHPLHRSRVQIVTSLDFLVVSDHAEFMGVVPKILQGDPLVTNTPTGRRYAEMAAAGKEIEVFGELIAQVNGVVPPNEDLNSPEVNSAVWGEIMDAADRNNDPGTFTAFMGWEWSSTPGGANLHRVVIMKEGRDKGEQFIPYSSLSSNKPEDLWAWLDKTSAETGAHFLAIPHNSNISAGKMFPLQDSEGSLLSPGYAQARMRWEPLVEITQIKGDSETHPNLSPTDEFADFETYDHLIAVEGAESTIAFTDGFLGALSEGDRAILQSTPPERIEQAGDYVRSGLLRGLVLEQRVGANPYRFGLIGSTDSHTGLASAEEDNFHGKMAIDSTPENKEKEIIPGTRGWDMGAAGLVAVWAEENTRASLFDAMQRKEVYATSGPRIGLRFFGGWDFSEQDTGRDLAASGYRRGVPMGGKLTGAPETGAPTFLVMVMKDPVEANLDRIQIIKGWLDDAGLPRELVFDVAWSGERQLDADGKLPAVGNTVDLQTGHYTNSIGDSELSAVWTDPEFDPSRPAFYYVRVLQIPTPRHTLLDAIALGIDPAETGHPATIQDRAYSSPIWYDPE